MTNESEHGHKVRLLLIMRTLIEQPFRFTKVELASRYGVHKDTISHDFRAMANAEFEVEHDNKYRYGFKVDKPYQALRDLLHFSEEEQDRLMLLLSQAGPDFPGMEKLRRKLANIYDYSRLGFENLRKPYLTKIDLLTKAEREKKRIWLLGYHSSNSNTVADRRVEPFNASTENDVLHAFDVDKQVLRHFRISRITGIRPTDEPWTFESQHVVHSTDPFRIVDSNQVLVHLRMKVGARNELIERFPLTRGHVMPSADDPSMFDFQCKVNHKFLGLSNFVLGNYYQGMEVLESESLLEHLREEVQKMRF